MKWLVNFEESDYDTEHKGLPRQHVVEAYETWQQSEYYIEPYIARLYSSDCCGSNHDIRFGIPEPVITKSASGEGDDDDDQSIAER